MGLFSKATDAYLLNETKAAAKRQGKLAAKAEAKGDKAMGSAHRRSQAGAYGEASRQTKQYKANHGKNKWAR